MSEVVPLPSFGEVFFDARGQERCLRVTWHEGTLVLSLWRGEMCTASFRMPMDDVGRLLDTLDDGYAEATGEQPAVPAHDPGTEVIPGTGQYQRPQQPMPPPMPQPMPQPMSPPISQQQPDERPTAALSPSDVLVARGTPAQDKPAPQDKLVASYGETTPPRGTPTSQPAPQYGEPFAGPQYTDPGTGQSYGAPSYRDPGRAEPFTGPQYVDESTPTGPQYSLDPDPFSGPHQVAASGERGYQMRPAPLSTDPLGFPSQAADPLGTPRHEPRHEPRQNHYAPADSGYHQPVDQGTAGLGTPMHGIPGAGRRRSAAPPPPVHDRYPSQDGYSGQDTPYPDAYRDGYSGQGSYSGQDAFPPPRQNAPNPVDPLLALGDPGPRQAQPDAAPLSRPYVSGDSMFSTGERLHPEEPYDERRHDGQSYGEQGYGEQGYGDGRHDRRYDDRAYDDRGERRDW
ncbi:hypothetical protein ACWGH8_08085 [Nonomuraea muscovyensis]